jgi:hypothetical protein
MMKNTEKEPKKFKTEITFGECEHQGDEAQFERNLMAHPKIVAVETIARRYLRGCDEVVFKVTHLDMTFKAIHDAGWETPEPPMVKVGPGHFLYRMGRK